MSIVCLIVRLPPLISQPLCGHLLMIHGVHSPNDALPAMAAVAIVYLAEGMELDNYSMAELINQHVLNHYTIDLVKNHPPRFRNGNESSCILHVQLVDDRIMDV